GEGKVAIWERKGGGRYKLPKIFRGKKLRFLAIMKKEDPRDFSEETRGLRPNRALPTTYV
ncbi:hypothetical protein HAX54_049016, partial [Datura stramonium]|nr:hypothetical protein [Datura stramonium]